MPKPWENLTQDEKIEELRREMSEIAGRTGELERQVAELTPKPLKHPLLGKPPAAKRKRRI